MEDNNSPVGSQLPFQEAERDEAEAERCTEITIFAKNGGLLTKRIKLTEDGSLTTTPAAQLTNGSARRMPIANVSELATVIEQLKRNEAIALGTLRADLPNEVKVVIKDKLNGADGVIARTSDFVDYRKGEPAFVLLDFDTKGMPANVVVKDFWKTLVKVLPALRSAAHVVRRSTSSGLYRTDTNQAFAGSSGMHVFIPVEDGADIERFLTTLHERCWLAGFGWFMISKAGTLLERSIIDRSVGQGERLVFEAPPVLTSPLAQDAESRRPIATEGDVLDTITACPPLTTAERATFDALVANAKKEIQSEAEKVRAAYVEERAEEMVERTGMSKEAAIQVIESTREGVLLSDVELIFSDKNLGRCTVGDVLDDPERFNKKALADLIEGPDYGRTTAMVLLRRDGTPWINSFAHGGVSYSLEREETAKDAGRKIELGSAEPTYPATNSRGVEEARQTLEQHIDAFIGTAATWNEDQASDSLFIQHWIRETDNQPPVHAIRASTGIGKTQGFAARLAQHRQTTDDKRPLLYLVPTHRLGEDTAEHFEKENLTARVYRGREAPDPKLLKEGLPKREQVKMCLNLEQVKLATACGQDVNSACCKNKEQQCKFYNDCAYQRQFEGERPDVWLAAHNMLFHPQKLFNDVAGIVIDETYYKHGIRGLDASKHEEEDKSFTLDDFVVKEGGDFAAPEYYDYHSGRGYLVDILREHPLGGLQRDLLVGKMTPEECTKYHGLEWQTVNSVQIVPQMTDGELSLITEKVPAIRRAKFMAGVWRGLRELLQMPEGTVSGRLVLEKKAGCPAEPRCARDHESTRSTDTDSRRDASRRFDPSHVASAGRGGCRYRGEDAPKRSYSAGPWCTGFTTQVVGY
jgi:hypothetical protein